MTGARFGHEFLLGERVRRTWPSDYTIFICRAPSNRVKRLS